MERMKIIATQRPRRVNEDFSRVRIGFPMCFATRCQHASEIDAFYRDAWDIACGLLSRYSTNRTRRCGATTRSVEQETFSEQSFPIFFSPFFFRYSSHSVIRRIRKWTWWIRGEKPYIHAYADISLPTWETCCEYKLLLVARDASRSSIAANKLSRDSSLVRISSVCSGYNRESTKVMSIWLYSLEISNHGVKQQIGKIVGFYLFAYLLFQFLE